MSDGRGTKPFDAAFGGSNRFTPSSAPCIVEVDGRSCAGEVTGRNGPRTQVRFERDGQSYVRWFDTEAVTVSLRKDESCDSDKESS